MNSAWVRRTEETIRRAGHQITGEGEVILLNEIKVKDENEEGAEVIDLKSKKRLRGVRDYIDKDDKSLNPTNMHILAGLQRKHVYAGTVPGAVKEQRRKKNKAARVARRKSRK